MRAYPGAVLAMVKVKVQVPMAVIEPLHLALPTTLTRGNRREAPLLLSSISSPTLPLGRNNQHLEVEQRRRPLGDVDELAAHTQCIFSASPVLLFILTHVCCVELSEDPILVRGQSLQTQHNSPSVRYHHHI